MASKMSGSTYRRPSVAIGKGLDGADHSYLTKPNKDGTGFFITFNVPFKRIDVFNELLNDDAPLGCDMEDVEYTILKAGREAGKEGWCSWHDEGAMLRTVAYLLLWDQARAPVADAFFAPFQSAPCD